MSRRGTSKSPLDPDAIAAALALIEAALHGLEYGQLVIQVHDGRVVQIDRTEKFRPPGRS